MAQPTFFVDDAAVAVRTVQVPNADWAGGNNIAASCSHGIGINYLGGKVVGTPEQFTLLTQTGATRAPQKSQLIGGSGLGSGTSGTAPNAPIRAATVSTNGDGTISILGTASLISLAAGWV